jgi:hypothetical protein
VVLADPTQGRLQQALIDRLGREAQVGRGAVLAVGDLAERFEQRPLDLAGEARLVEGQVRQLDAEGRRDGGRRPPG